MVKLINRNALATLINWRYLNMFVCAKTLLFIER